MVGQVIDKSLISGNDGNYYRTQGEVGFGVGSGVEFKVDESGFATEIRAFDGEITPKKSSPLDGLNLDSIKGEVGGIFSKIKEKIPAKKEKAQKPKKEKKESKKDSKKELKKSESSSEILENNAQEMQGNNADKTATQAESSPKFDEVFKPLNPKKSDKKEKKSFFGSLFKKKEKKSDETLTSSKTQNFSFASTKKPKDNDKNDEFSYQPKF